ncbi:MAG: hypothetical protein IJV48_06330 [Ruminococcus sp.]|nr:hypothetical protein [Ruminococcus sp.]
MKRFLAIILILIMMTSSAVCAAEVQSPSLLGENWTVSDYSTLIGDIDGDGEFNVMDVVYLQLYLAGLSRLSDSGQRRADVELNGAVESIDVTYLQRFLVGYVGDHYIGFDVDEAQAIVEARQRRQRIIDEIENFTRSKGVDISVFNGNVDMNRLKAEGYSFVIIRLGYGDDETDQDDSMFETNVKKAEAAGLDWGAYIYSYALSAGEAKSEVNHTLRLLKGKHPTMPIAFDWEDDSYKQRMGMPSNAEVLKIASTYMDGIRSAGYYPIIYTGYYWLKGAFNDKTFLDKNDIWLAQWAKTYDYKDRPIGMWQYGGETNYLESPYISGLSGMFDKDYSYKNYPMIIKAYGYNNFEPLLQSYASTGAEPDDGIVPESENLPPECNGVMGDSFK